MSFLQLLRPGRRSLIEICAQLPELGVGKRLTRVNWHPYGNSWWEITKVKVRKDGKHGTVYGIKVWKGVPSDSPMRVSGGHKKVWRWMLTPEEELRYRAASLRLERTQQAPAAALDAADTSQQSSAQA